MPKGRTEVNLSLDQYVPYRPDDGDLARHGLETVELFNEYFDFPADASRPSDNVACAKRDKKASDTHQSCQDVLNYFLTSMRMWNVLAPK